MKAAVYEPYCECRDEEHDRQYDKTALLCNLRDHASSTQLKEELGVCSLVLKDD